MTAQPTVHDLPESLGAAAATDLAAALTALRGQPLSLRAGAVRRVGGQCVQVLVSAAATWRADGRPLRIDEPSAEFNEALRLLGLPDGALAVEAAAGGDIGS